jgi:hypothetical protein
VSLPDGCGFASAPRDELVCAKAERHGGGTGRDDRSQSAEKLRPARRKRDGDERPGTEGDPSSSAQTESEGGQQYDQRTGREGASGRLPGFGEKPSEEKHADGAQVAKRV